MLRSFMGIESGGNPYARTGSYKGLFQLSDSEFAKYGGGNVYDPEDNTRAAAAKLAAERDAFKAQYGREPTATDLYLTHQQGSGGYAAHTANPSAPAWQNMYSTAEGQQKGPEWAKKAIWGNVPEDVRHKYPGGVESMTSQQFMDLWRDKVKRFGGGGEMENTWMWDSPQPGMTTVDGRAIPNSAAFPNIAKALVGNGGAAGVDPLMVYSAQFPGGGAQTPNRGVTITAPSAPAPTVGTVNPKLAALLAGLEAPDSTGKSRAERLQNMADNIKANNWMDVAAKGLGSLFGGMAQADATKEEKAYSKRLGEAIAAAGDDPAALRALMTRIAPAKALESAMSPKNHDWRVNAELGVMYDEKTGEMRRIGAGPKTQAELAKMEAEADKYKSEAEKNRRPPDPNFYALKVEQGLRKEWSDYSKEYRTLTDQYSVIRNGAKSDTPAGDMAVVFGYMKMLDPTSAVRETEYATAENAAGIPERIQNMWNKVKDGTRLTESQRAEFASMSKKILADRNKALEPTRDRIGTQAKRYGLNPNDILVNYGAEDEGGEQDDVSPGQIAVAKKWANPAANVARNAAPSQELAQSIPGRVYDEAPGTWGRLLERIAPEFAGARKMQQSGVTPPSPEAVDWWKSYWTGAQ